ncbi:MAG: FMN-binding protein [Spirochaetales bacterium]|jgi:Na+-transporting NADH:ubiquinone oxidoreductase subunit C|nr:FMN-binding protein [Spirochaetales bacterium]
MKADMRVIIFAVILAAVCSLLLTGADQLLKPFREANEEAEEISNFLSALGVPVPEDADSQELIDIYEKNVTLQKLGNLDFYIYSPASGGGDPAAYALPFDGAGLWGPVFGVLALEPDMITIRGIRFYKQEETPGLGGEIGASWFQDQFKGKKITSASGDYGFEIIKPGSVTGPNRVDGITGATMTSDRVGIMIDDVVKLLGEEWKSNVQ